MQEPHSCDLPGGVAAGGSECILWVQEPHLCDPATEVLLHSRVGYIFFLPPWLLLFDWLIRHSCQRGVSETWDCSTITQYHFLRVSLKSKHYRPCVVSFPTIYLPDHGQCAPPDTAISYQDIPYAYLVPAVRYCLELNLTPKCEDQQDVDFLSSTFFILFFTEKKNNKLLFFFENYNIKKIEFLNSISKFLYTNTPESRDCGL